MVNGDDAFRSDDEPETTGVRFGEYWLLEPIGDKGGNGIVYRAMQTNPRRPVALKRLKTGADAGSTELERFKIEINAIAGIQHRNVIEVLSSGEIDGEVYYSMPLLQGGSLLGRLRDNSTMPPSESVRIIRDVADAVACAHQAGVIHRDLKPANIIFDRDNTPIVIDFGCARLSSFDGHLTAASAQPFLGTFYYMSPEQSNSPHDVDERTDIFSVGAVLYECLVGRPPYLAPDLLETLSLLSDPDYEPADPRRLNPKVPRDLEAICLKCIAKDPNRRYRTAIELRDDLDAFTSGSAISARPVTRARSLVRWCARNRLTAASVLMTLGCLLAALIVTTFLYREENRTRRELADAKLELDDTLSTKEEQFRQLQVAEQKLKEEKQELRRVNSDLLRQERLAKESLYINQYSTVEAHLSQKRPRLAKQALNDLKGRMEEFRLDPEWELSYARQRLFDREAAVYKEHMNRELRCLDVAASPNGRSIVYGGEKGLLRLLELGASLSSGRNLSLSTDLPPDVPIADVAIDDPGEVIAVAAGNDVVLLKRDVDGWSQHEHALSGSEEVSQVAITPDSRSWIAGTKAGGVITDGINNDNSDWAREDDRHDGEIIDVAVARYSDDGDFADGSGEDNHCLVVTASAREVKLWEVETGTSVLSLLCSRDFESTMITSVAFQPGTHILWIGDASGSIYRWRLQKDLRQEIDLTRMASVPGAVYTIAFDQTGDRFITAGEDPQLRVWRVDQRLERVEQLYVAFGHGREIWAASFLSPPRVSPLVERLVENDSVVDRGTVVSVSADGTLRFARPINEQPQIYEGANLETVDAIAFHSGLREMSETGLEELLVAGADSAGERKIVRVQPARSPDGQMSFQIEEVCKFDHAVVDLCTLRTPQLGFACLESSGQVTIFPSGDAANGIVVDRFDAGDGEKAVSICYLSGVGALAVLTSDSRLLCFDPTDGGALPEIAIPDSFRLQGIHKGNESLLGMDDQGRLLVWKDSDWQSGFFAPISPGLSEDRLAGLAFSPSGGRVAIPFDESILIRGAASGTRIMKLDGKAGAIRAIAYSPDGRGLAAADSEGNLLFWYTESL